MILSNGNESTTIAVDFPLINGTVALPKRKPTLLLGGYGLFGPDGRPGGASYQEGVTASVVTHANGTTFVEIGAAPAAAARTISVGVGLRNQVSLYGWDTIQIPICLPPYSAATFGDGGIGVWFMLSDGSAMRALLSVDGLQPSSETDCVVNTVSINRSSLFSGGTLPDATDKGLLVTGLQIVLNAGTAGIPYFRIGEPVVGARRARGAVTIYIDGMRDGVLQRALPLLERNNMRANVAAVFKGALYGPTTFQLGDVVKEGHRICLHSYGASADKGWGDATAFPTYESIVQDLRDGFAAVEAWDAGMAGHCVVGGVSPFSVGLPAERKEWVRKALVEMKVKTCRLGGRYLGAGEGLGTTFSIADGCDLTGLRGGIMFVNQVNDLATYKAQIDSFLGRGELLSIVIHEVIPAGSTAEVPLGVKEEVLVGLIEHLAAARDHGLVDVETIDVIHERYDSREYWAGGFPTPAP